MTPVSNNVEFRTTPLTATTGVLERDDVFVNPSKTQTQKVQSWQLPDTEQSPLITEIAIARKAFNDDANPSSIYVKARQPARKSIADKFAGVCITTTKEATKFSLQSDCDGLSTPPLSPTSSTTTESYDVPVTPLSAELPQLARYLPQNEILTPPTTLVLDQDIGGFQNTTTCQSQETLADIADAAVKQQRQPKEVLEIDASTLSILQADHSNCSACTTSTIDGKDFAIRCKYMFEHKLYDSKKSPLEDLRTFRPLHTSKIIALVNTNTKGEDFTRIFSCDSRSGVFHPSSFTDLITFQKTYGEDLVTTCQERCEEHARGAAVWTIEIRGLIREGKGTLVALTKEMIAEERKHVLKRKLSSCQVEGSYDVPEVIKRRRLRLNAISVRRVRTTLSS